ncbi:unnamed protein product [Meloidogyne enterolobii]|uniref:Uncharacterized protein n=1 Tax=Meloidogyne enterolobii TaxID=390850 RepID=A0ACB1A208_MELEN
MGFCLVYSYEIKFHFLGNLWTVFCCGFGKGVSRGLGVAATIMSKMGYREGSGLGAKEQGISRALQVQRTGRNVGLIVGEEKASAVFTNLLKGMMMMGEED